MECDNRFSRTTIIFPDKREIINTYSLGTIDKIVSWKLYLALMNCIFDKGFKNKECD